MVYWLRPPTHASSAGGMGSIPGQGTKDLTCHTAKTKQNKTNPLNRQTEKPKKSIIVIFLKMKYSYYVVLKDFLENTVSDLPYRNYRKVSLCKLNAESSPYYQLSHQNQNNISENFPLIF